MNNKRPVILLVEDKTDDVELTRRGFAHSTLASEIVVASGGHEALDYQFASGRYTGRDRTVMPSLLRPFATGLNWSFAPSPQIAFSFAV